MIIALAALRQFSISRDEELLPRDPTATSSGNHRTPWIIVQSCLATIFACTWIAVHPNLPFKGERPFVRRLKIFVIALMAPELIIAWAIRQWLVSRRLAGKYKDYGWTQTHGFFTIMGGFQICESDNSKTRFRTLKLDELEPFLKDGTITVSEEEIQDRSKGDFLSKALVLLQVSWFILQALVRAKKGLAITELELVTSAYAILNFIVYFCWWNKPLDVHSPIKINKRSSSSNPLVISAEVGFGGNLGPLRHDLTQLSSSHLILEPNRPRTPGTPNNASQQPTVDIELSPLLVTNTLYRSGDESRLSMDGNRGLESWRKSTADAIDNFWHQFVKLFSGINSEDSAYASGTLTDSEKKGSAYLACMIAAIFGAVQCIGWQFDIPNEVERWLWRTSSIAITVIPICFIVLHQLENVVESVANSKPRYSKHILVPPLWMLEVGHGYIYLLGVLLYPVARMILLVQMFVLLRNLDRNTLTSVDWVTYIPHL